MSYFGSGEVADTTSSVLVVVSPQADDAHDESVTQIAAAEAAARSLIESGAFGTGPHMVTISGHANPGNTPHPGVSPDQVSVLIVRVATTPAPDAAVAAPATDASPPAGQAA